MQYFVKIDCITSSVELCRALAINRSGTANLVVVGSIIGNFNCINEIESKTWNLSSFCNFICCIL